MAMHSQVVAAEWAWWIGLLLGAIPLLALAVWYANDAGHRAAFALKRCWRRRLPLPPGHMGLPFIGESLSLLWYFKLARRPDGFVDAKKKRYGDGAGVYRTHLFGSPTVLVCSPAANKFVLQSSQDAFGIRWPAPELVGVSSIVNVEGRKHARLRGFILAAINRPGSLRTIAEVVQPRVVAALRSWAHKGTITAATEIKKVTFENICKMFVSMDPSPLTDMIDECFAGLVAGFRAFPLDLPGTAYRHARAVRAKRKKSFHHEVHCQGGRRNYQSSQHFSNGSSRGTQRCRVQRQLISHFKFIGAFGYSGKRKVNNLASTLHAGYTIPKGWRVVVWLRSLHTDPNYYDDPLSFNPTDGTWELLNPDAEISYLPHSKPVDGAAMSFSKLNSD
ncbi:hypothetical protein HU200_024980 [Digitaria exilis]|uniref:Cytochrome P450 n=1 Tax=Digitaria exilis TaxID=1010633 RepID=A0A835BXD9_9POAL|nr:hypothetical protein HU200_024980 [Digitaria exilis]